MAELRSPILIGTAADHGHHVARRYEAQIKIIIKYVFGVCVLFSILLRLVDDKLGRGWARDWPYGRATFNI